MGINNFKQSALYSSTMLVGLLFFSGCATVHDMGLTKETKTLELNGKGLVLMSMEVSNQYKTDYQPQILVAHVETPDAKERADRHNFKTDMDGTVSSANGTRYLLRMELTPGHYVVRGASCMYRSIFLMAQCMMPVHGDIEVKADSVTYIGRASGVMRERQSDEFRAGPVIPLVDQNVTGFAGSTFDVTITDKSAEDLSSYQGIFPALKTTTIDVNILPPFNRERAQLWWRSNGSKDKPENEQANLK
ncbi:hypothetical protein MMIC_P1164 [Mariprofundus micogutta]|uniref:Lipoprotein n=1 Tax=Mariprofundus micogutta TaxID=1921010 RepID=A0A1L8CMP9_9PROT|nr:hypothetical protein [Mariprofundus micogutta]GAV20200.1 hypothetical protein MMIC_P1164 [Mariprofundus micogutta]